MSPSKKAPKQIVGAKRKNSKAVKQTVSKKRASSNPGAGGLAARKNSRNQRRAIVRASGAGRLAVGGKGEAALAVRAHQISAIEKPSALTTQPAAANILRAFALLAVIGITLYIYSIRSRVEDFAAFGYPGIFLIALLANATILLPAPGLAVIYAMGAIFNPLGVGLAAGTGGAIGELSGYLAGFSGQAVIERADVYQRIKPWVDKYGGWAILVLAAIPNPFFDAVGIAAGIAKMRLGTFLFFAWIGQLIKMTFFAYAGRYSIEWITRLIS